MRGVGFACRGIVMDLHLSSGLFMCGCLAPGALKDFPHDLIGLCGQPFTNVRTQPKDPRTLQYTKK